ncbi:twin-arginine translocase subunit TatC [Flavobacterium difficile]|uniref:Sec-independent protein translocase protein TatC n=1 Tax=Flavobacterium difficile TaxID=2709659 RepID=A0ABX0I657_9FLAO|nr:twin-arginine translocase subunit TatC [Flavobacterium difficile]NHM00961.1 twin-arginine translocase subunit TatC [Flavobacterium difficile]
MAKKNKKNINEMTFLDHLEELRWLLVRSSAAILIGGAIAYFFNEFIFNTIIFGPMKGDFITYQFFCDLANTYDLDKSFCDTTLNFSIQNTEIEGQISLMVWTCITAGFVICFPYILLQFWNFISPALYKKEKRNAVKFIVISSLLFFLGVAFGYFVLTPLSLNFLSTFSVSDVIKNDINVNSYIGTVKTTTLATGLVFELPIIIYFLSSLGLVTPAFLREYRKWAYVIILIIAAIVTPPDVISQIIVTIPLVVLFEISIIISAFINNKNKKSISIT